VGAQNSVAGLPSIPEGDEPLGSPQPGTASEVVAFGREGPVVAAAIMPQPAKTLTTIATIDGLPLDRGAVLTPVSRRSQALPSLEPTPKVESRPVANPQSDETWPEAAPAMAAEPKILATAVGSPVPAALSSLSAEPSRDAPLPQQSMTSSAASVSARAMTSAAEAIPAASPRVEAGEPNRPRILPVAGDPRRTGSAVGAPSGRAQIRFDGPRARVTQKDVETVTGKIAGGTMDRVLVYVNEIPMELAIGAGSFQASVPLQPGLNQLRAVAAGQEGLDTEDSIAIEYAPPVSSNGVALTSPADGFIVAPEDPPVIVVEGRVDDKSATTLWLVANDRRIAVRVSDGRFRKILPVVEPTLRVWAETSRAGEPGSRSQIVTVHTTGQRKPSGVLVMEWPRGSQDLDVEVSALWRPHPDRLHEAAQPVRLAAVLKPSGTGPLDVFWLRNVRPGVYTMILRYRGLPPNGEVHPTLYVPDRDGLAARVFRPVRLDSAGKAILAKMLLPQGVLWEQDGWFSGSSESVDTVTKFRFPEGINWVERKADLQ
jgi:hypothetical protein